MSDFALCNGEFLLIDDYVDQLPDVTVKEIHELMKPPIEHSVPALVKCENSEGVPFPILCIKLALQDGASFVYIPTQTIIIPNPNDSRLFIHKIGVMSDSEFREQQGFLLIPEWGVCWNSSKKNYYLHFNSFLHYYLGDCQPTPSEGQTTRKKVIHQKKNQMEIDQEREGDHYKLLLPPCSVVLSGNVPKQLVNNRLLARFKKISHADFITLEFVNRQLARSIDQKSVELLDIKLGALELTGEVYIIPENIQNIQTGLCLRTLRKSLSSKNRFPHLFANFRGNEEDVNIICFHIYSRQIKCDYRCIPFQVIIREEASDLLIFYIGLPTAIHVDTNPNLLHLPGMSIIVEDHARYRIEFDLKLRYEEESERILLSKQSSPGCRLTNAIHLNKVPDEFRVLEGEKPHILRTLPLDVTFIKAGELRYYGNAGALGSVQQVIHSANRGQASGQSSSASGIASPM